MKLLLVLCSHFLILNHLLLQANGQSDRLAEELEDTYATPNWTTTNCAATNTTNNETWIKIVVKEALGDPSRRADDRKERLEKGLNRLVLEATTQWFLSRYNLTNNKQPRRSFGLTDKGLHTKIVSWWQVEQGEAIQIEANFIAFYNCQPMCSTALMQDVNRLSHADTGAIVGFLFVSISGGQPGEGGLEERTIIVIVFGVILATIAFGWCTLFLYYNLCLTNSHCDNDLKAKESSTEMTAVLTEFPKLQAIVGSSAENRRSLDKNKENIP